MLVISLYCLTNKTMKNIYCLLWIVWIRNCKNEKDWKFNSIFYMSMFNVTNIYSIRFVLEWYFNINLFHNFSGLTSVERLDNIIGLSQVAFPIFILNYFLFFYKSRYEKMINKYHYKYGREAVIVYISVTMIAFFGLIVFDLIYGH